MLTPTNQKNPSSTFPKEIEALYQKYWKRVLQWAYRTTQNKADAEEVLQIVFVRLIEGRDAQTEFCKNPEAYLYRAAINEALRVIRWRNRQRTVDDNIDGMEIPAPDQFDAAHDIQRVRAAMATISKGAAEILRLYYYEQYNCRDIAKLRGKRVHAVFKELYRARAEFKEAILRQEKENETQKEKHEGNDLSVHTESSGA
jgi:RNA polymerase sigma-70 factor (ECF subfamily)